ncbi:hypothetical protein [aff. Roholtiella sp. LEGE 12411]|uniref:hypothetical protein n=1 Tax=aff. Roholtiella sp. LEGE 12411 TaxID=1828822 RepID=UPI0018801929|nr:hypothetical protein [aff. Roholtiella sp. LEGE 12411]MBE9035840.1 hypothetical protein [aff. Roholtiella sp. LEGE 12411]
MSQWLRDRTSAYKKRCLRRAKPTHSRKKGDRPSRCSAVGWRLGFCIIRNCDRTKK